MLDRERRLITAFETLFSNFSAHIKSVTPIDKHTVELIMDDHTILVFSFVSTKEWSLSTLKHEANKGANSNERKAV